MKNMNKLLLTFILGIFLISFISAEVETLGEVHYGNCINLVQTCSDCNTTIWSNLTKIQYPDKTIDYFNIPMEKHNKNYNYTFCNTSQLGEYIVTICTDVEGSEVCPPYNFYSTKTGNSLSQSETNIGTSTIYFIAILAIVFIVFGLFLTGQNFWLSWGGIFSIVFGFILMYYNLSLVNLYVNSIAISGSSAEGIFLLFTRFIKVLPYIFALIVAFAIAKLVRMVIKNKKSDDGWDNNQY